MKHTRRIASGSGRTAARLLSSESSQWANSEGPSVRVDAPLVREADTGVFGAATDAMADAVPVGSGREETARLVRQAGYLSRSAYTDFAAIRYALTMCSIPILGVALLVASSVWEPLIIGMLVTIPFLLWIAPLSVVRRLANRRNAEIARGVPELMSLMSACLQQGLSVPTALSRAASGLRDTCPALAQEVALVGVQADVATLSHALRVFRDRIDIPEIATLTSVLIQSDELGSSVCGLLERNSANLRRRQTQQAHARSRLTPGRVIVPTLIFLVPAALLVVYAPAIVGSLADIDAAVVRAVGQ